MYGEPDWSSLSSGELFEKADAFAQKAYSSSLSTYSFLQHALEKSPDATGLDQEIVELIGKVQTTYQILAELQTKLDELAQEFLCKSVVALLSSLFFLLSFGFSSNIEPLLLFPKIAFLVPSEHFSRPKIVKWLMLPACHTE